MKKILHWFVEGQTYFGKVLEKVWSSTNQTIVLFIQIQIQTLPPRMHHKWKEISAFACKTTNETSWGANSFSCSPI